MRVLIGCLGCLFAGQVAAQTSVRLYERPAETLAAVFPDAGKAGSPLHERMMRLQPETGNAGHPVILAVRAAAQLQQERPEAAPNVSDVTARCLGLVEKTYGPLNASSSFAKAFWDYVPEVHAQLPDFRSTGAWPLAAGALAELKLQGSPAKNGSRAGPDFSAHQHWMLASGSSEWPPKPPTQRPAPITLLQTSPDTWHLSDGTTLTRTGSGTYQVGK